MNDRLELLAEEAGFRYIKDEGIGWAGNHNASLPLFAELIVRKCIEEIKKAAPTRTEDEFGEGAQWAFRESVIVIKEYFGVK